MYERCWNFLKFVKENLIVIKYLKRNENSKDSRGIEYQSRITPYKTCDTFQDGASIPCELINMQIKTDLNSRWGTVRIIGRMTGTN